MKNQKVPDKIIEGQRNIIKKLDLDEIHVLESLLDEKLEEGIEIGRDEMRKEFIEFILNTITAVPELNSIIWRDKIIELQSKGDKK